jgi:hypothetical protein
MPNPRPRWSGSTLERSGGAGKPWPLSLISTVSLLPSKAQKTANLRERVVRPCSTALLKASPAASRISATASSENPQTLAKLAMPFRASATFRMSLVKVARYCVLTVDHCPKRSRVSGIPKPARLPPWTAAAACGLKKSGNLGSEVPAAWAISSVGRAPPLQGGSRRFEPVIAHIST